MSKPASITVGKLIKELDKNPALDKASKDDMHRLLELARTLVADVEMALLGEKKIVVNTPDDDEEYYDEMEELYKAALSRGQP